MLKEDVGEMLRTARLSFGLSQRKLAKQSGVANATISQIESGSFNPTIGMLKKILSGFPMSLSEFFSEDDVRRQPSIFFGAGELTEISDGGVSYRQVGRNLNGRAIQLMCERYEPGATTGRHALKHLGEECGVVIKGRLTVTVGDQTRVLGPGDAYYFNSETPHSFKNEHTDICELISACTPPSF